MTLKSQLWIGIASLMFISFVGSFVVSNAATRSHLVEQIRQRNIDNVNSLALSLSSSESDPVTRELLLSAQFDTGHYLYIEFQNTDSPIRLGSREERLPPGVPTWFASMLSIEPPPGVAQISDGWRSIGTLELASDTRFAYMALWKNTKRLCIYFSLAAVAFGLIGSLLLRGITRPLRSVVDQAIAIGERRFPRIEVPWTFEFRVLAGAMNGLSERVEQMVTAESTRLADLHRSQLHDPLTGLLQREPFMERLSTLLKREDASAEGTVVILRIMTLSDLNRRHGRATLDAVLKQIGERLTREVQDHEGMLAARLNGSEFAVVVPGGPEPGELGVSLRMALVAACEDCSVEAPAIAAGATDYRYPDTLPQLLQRTDQALAAAEQSETGGVEVAEASVHLERNSHDELLHWSALLEDALGQDRFELKLYPVVDRSGTLLHWEAPSRLRSTGGELTSAAQFMPWVARLGRMPELDRVIVRVAQQHIGLHSQPLGINLSSRILEDRNALDRLLEQLASQPQRAALLWLEVPENGVYARLDGFRHLCRAARPLGCQIGIEHAGPRVAQMGELFDVGLDYVKPRVAQMGELFDVGLDYVKLDASLIRGIEANRGNQAFVQGFCTIVHAIGLRAIAEGIESEAEWITLRALGIDGGTGRFFAEMPP